MALPRRIRRRRNRKVQDAIDPPPALCTTRDAQRANSYRFEFSAAMNRHSSIAGFVVSGAGARHRANMILVADTASRPRGLARPSFALFRTPSSSEGAGKTGCRLAPTVHCAKVALQEAAQRHTGEAQHTAFPAQWFYGLCRVLPGERCTIAPVALRMADAACPVGQRHHHKT